MEESYAIHQTWQAEGSVASVLILLGAIERESNNPAAAIALIEEAQAIFQRLDRRGDIAWALRDRGIAEVVAGSLEDASYHLLASLAIYEEIGGRDGVAIVLEGMASVAAARGQAARCAQLLGAAMALRQQLCLAPALYSARIEACIFRPTRRQLSLEHWETEMAAGRALQLSEALALARSV